MPTVKSGSKSGPKAPAARRRVSGPRPRIPGNTGLRGVMDRRDQLFTEARKDPDSQASQMVQMFTLSGMLAGQTGAPRAFPADEGRTELEGIVCEQTRRLEEIARATQKAQAEQWDPRRICSYIAEVVGLKPPSGVNSPEEFQQMLAHPPRAEETCQTQSSQTPAEPTPIPVRPWLPHR